MGFVPYKIDLNFLQKNSQAIYFKFRFINSPFSGQNEDMKKCLIVIDYQVDFVCGSLGFERAKTLEKPIAEKIKEYRKNSWDVFFTLDTHYSDYLSTSEGKFLSVAHCIEGSEGQALYGEIQALKRDSDICFIKSSFGSGSMYEFFKKSDYTHIELCGLVTNICVLSNAVLLKTALPEAQILVNSSLCAASDEDLHRKALEIMTSLGMSVL